MQKLVIMVLVEDILALGSRAHLERHGGGGGWGWRGRGGGEIGTKGMDSWGYTQVPSSGTSR